MSDYKKEVNKEIQFTDKSTNSPTSWSWNFGDTGTSIVQNPVHTYTTIGTKTITLVTSNTCGNCTAIIKTVEIVAELPKADEGISTMLILGIATGLGLLLYATTRNK